jgi:hypothetical protein
MTAITNLQKLFKSKIKEQTKPKNKNSFVIYHMPASFVAAATTIMITTTAITAVFFDIFCTPPLVYLESAI